MDHDSAFCPVYSSIELLQEKWTLHIIRALLEGPQGFNELGRSVGANPSTLVQRLERLETIGIVERTVHSVMPPRTSYGLTLRRRRAPGRHRRSWPLGHRPPQGATPGQASHPLSRELSPAREVAPSR